MIAFLTVRVLALVTTPMILFTRVTTLPTSSNLRFCLFIYV
jgi:hypothetical protein